MLHWSSEKMFLTVFCLVCLLVHQSESCDGGLPSPADVPCDQGLLCSSSVLKIQCKPLLISTTTLVVHIGRTQRVGTLMTCVKLQWVPFLSDIHGCTGLVRRLLHLGRNLFWYYRHDFDWQWIVWSVWPVQLDQIAEVASAVCFTRFLVFTFRILQHNLDLVGSIPESFYGCTFMENCILSQTNITGQLSKKIGDMKLLKTMCVLYFEIC